jgi:ATP-dependent protease HslVU (ClpYQ) peptidase subunit
VTVTTIAATVDMMAADTQVTAGETVIYHTHKIYRVGDTILGPVGHTEACQRFLDWWERGRPRGLLLRIPKRLDFEALALNAQGLWAYAHSGPPDQIIEGYTAIGSGEDHARAALDTMLELGRVPDPRVAVKIALKRNNMTGGRVESLRLRKR